MKKVLITLGVIAGSAVLLYPYTLALIIWVAYHLGGGK